MFTISYSCAVIAPVLSGLLWDITGIAWSAFVPLGLCACILMVLAATIRLRRRREAEAVSSPRRRTVPAREALRTFSFNRGYSTNAASAAEQRKEWIMLGWALTFLVVALIAAVLGFGGIAGLSIEIAKIIFFVAIVLFLISAVIGLLRGRSPTVT